MLLEVTTHVVNVTTFDWSRKSLGFPNETPENCPSCGELLSRKGWEKWGDMVNCRACFGTFEIPRNREAAS